MTRELRQRVSCNLLALRQNAALSQSTLADEISISRSTYCQYELGERLPDVDTLYRLCRFYHIHMDTLLNCDIRTVLQEYYLYMNYTPSELTLLRLYNSLSAFSRGRLMERAEELARQDQRKQKEATTEDDS